MRSIFLTLFLFCLLQDTIAQVNGKLLSSEGQAIPSATVFILLSKDSSLVKSALTDEQGFFRIENIPAGTFFARFSSIGYRRADTDVFQLSLSQISKDLGTIVLPDDNLMLEEVKILSAKPMFVQNPEGITVNVANSVMSKGSTVLQVLERSPGVSINRRDNDISLNGKNGVTVLLNGRSIRMPAQQLVTFLNGLSADNIEKLELLTSPPAGYDAEGSAGLINIIMKKNKQQGTNGSVSLTTGYSYREKITVNSNLSYNTSKIDLYGSYTYGRNNTYSNMYIASAQHMPFLGGDVSTTMFDTTKVLLNNHDLSGGFDLRPDSNLRIGANLIYNHSSRAGGSRSYADINIFPDSLLKFTAYNHGTNRWNNFINSAYLEKELRTGGKINLDVDYMYFRNKNPYQVESSFLNEQGNQVSNSQNLFAPGQRGTANTTIHVGVAKADYSRKINEKLAFQTGVKGTYTSNSSISGIESLVNGAWLSTNQTSNAIDMKEYTGAAHISFNIKSGNSSSLVLGSRYEYSRSKMGNLLTGTNIADRKLGVLFPSLLFTQKLTEESELQFSYTKRISRPTYNDLASYVSYSDPTAVYTGNPLLKPSLVDNIRIGYNYGDYAFSLLYSNDKNEIVRNQISESPTADVLYISPQNLDRQRSLSFQVNAPFVVNAWWIMNYSMNAGIRNTSGSYTKQPYDFSYFRYSLNMTQTFNLAKGFSAELSGRYNSYFYNGSIKIGAYGILNAGIKKEFDKNAGSIQLAVSDILGDEIFNVRYGSRTQEAFSVKNNVIVSTESARSPIFKFTFTKPFGTAVNNRTRKLSGSQDELNRVIKN